MQNSTLKPHILRSQQVYFLAEFVLTFKIQKWLWYTSLFKSNSAYFKRQSYMCVTSNCSLKNIVFFIMNFSSRALQHFNLKASWRIWGFDSGKGKLCKLLWYMQIRAPSWKEFRYNQMFLPIKKDCIVLGSMNCNHGKLRTDCFWFFLSKTFCLHQYDICKSIVWDESTV